MPTSSAARQMLMVKEQQAEMDKMHEVEKEEVLEVSK